MLTSIAVILLLGLLTGWIFSKLKLPSLLGMVIVGIVLSPYALNLIDESILMITGELRQIALVIILTRAGLSLDISDLKKVGRPAVLMCFVPACVEILGTVVLAPILLGVSMLEAAIVGSVIAAVSPAVVVPRMIRLIEEGYGKNKSIPQLILAGASVDDVFVIVVFTAFTALASTGEMSVVSFIQIPISIVLGIILGGCVGILLVAFFKKCHMRDSVKILIILSISFLLLETENRLHGYIPISGLLAIMSMGIIIKQKYNVLALRLSAKYNKLWLGAEVFLFVLVGATVDLRYVVSAGASAVLLILGALLFRMIGVALSLLKTDLSKKERLFCMVAYTPKATVQAAIGAIPLSMGLDCGNVVLTVAVLSILITAPFGAICVDNLYKRLLPHVYCSEGERNIYMKKVIFWDSDGTLLYGNESFKSSLIKSFKEFGYTLEEGDARDFMRSVCSWYVPEKDHSGKSGEEWWNDLLEEIGVFCEKHGVHRSDITPICNSFRKNVITFEYEAYSDAKNVLCHFKEMGYENYVISNNFPELGKVFERLELDSEISGYFLSASIGYEKPRKEIFEYSILNAGNPEICYMIGDNPVTDYQGGLEAGMTPILVHNMEAGKLCCERLTDLFDIIDM